MTLNFHFNARKIFLAKQLYCFMIILPEEMEGCISGSSANPHEFLGFHRLSDRKGSVIRVWEPSAERVEVVCEGGCTRLEMQCIDPRGFFELHMTDREFPFQYSLTSFFTDSQRDWIDPYMFLPSCTNESLSQFNSGIERRPFQKLGAIPTLHGQHSGVSFVVWAPSAKSVHLIGDFNDWSPISLPMRSLGSSGCWELFLPAAEVGDKYKFHILGADGVFRDKTDPFGSRFEPPPGNASIICNSIVKKNKDKLYNNPQENPISIYEMHLGSWRASPQEDRCLSYVELSQILPEYLSQNGYTHVEFMPLSEFPYGKSWGYQVTGYYAPTYRYGTPNEFQILVKSLQNRGIGVLIDWVPAHFPSDDFSLARFDGTCLFEHEDPRQGQHAEWGTLCYNYGRSEVKSFLIGSAIYWLDRFGIDGFRVDAVASMLYLDYGRKEGEWIANKDGGNYNYEAIEFLKQFNQAIHEEHPSVVSIAEESTAFPKVTKPPHTGGLGFDFKWNMGWMHDIMNYFAKETNEKSQFHDLLTFGATYQFSENFIQSFSHDEVVYGKGSLANKMSQSNEEDKIANLRALLALQWFWPGKKSLFMGCEFGQWNEWDFDSFLDWELFDKPLHAGVAKLISDLNHLYKSHFSWFRNDHNMDKFSWVDCDDRKGQTLSFLKYGTEEKDTLLVACNFSNKLRHRSWGCPHSGKWNVILDTDSPDYQGDGAAGNVEFLAEEKAGADLPMELTFSVNRFSVRVLSKNH